MKFFGRYLRQHRLAILLLILSWGLLAASFALYGLPLAAVAYPALLSLLLCLAAAVWDYTRTLRRHRKLSELQTAANAQLMDLPEPASIEEGDCMAAIAALRRAASERETADAARYREMVDYYTAWVHQIKTPIAAMRLTLQPDDTPNARRLMSQLLRIEQYVDMVLMYLRLDEGTSDFVIRACDLDGIIRQSLRKFAGEFIDRKLTLHYEPLHLSVVTDEKWLGFVVEQVLSNALKYTPEGGGIRLLHGGQVTSVQTHLPAGQRYRPVPLPPHLPRPGAYHHRIVCGRGGHRAASGPEPPHRPSGVSV